LQGIYISPAETGFYYVSSRYYDPEIERFINADAVELIGANGDFTSVNLFAYCGNNPVMREDKGGHFWNLAAGALLGGIINGFSQVITNVVTGSEWNSGLVGAIVTGAASGAVSASSLGRTAQMVVNAGIGLVSEVVNQISAGTLTTKEGLDSVMKATVVSAVSGYLGGNGMRHESSNYYKAAQSAKQIAEKVFSKTYGTSKTPIKILNQATKMVKKVGYAESQKTATKFFAGCMASQVVTRYEY